MLNDHGREMVKKKKGLRSKCQIAFVETDAVINARTQLLEPCEGR